MQRVAAGELGAAARRLARDGVPRIVVAGGDGTVASAANALRGTSTALALVPAGTLNHLAQDLGIPLDPEEAARVAESERVITVDAGSVNGRAFINTSSVGVYVAFVRLRDRLERRIGYRLASVVAGLRLLFRTRTFRVTLEVEGTTKEYETPLVFVGVGERELRLPLLGSRIAGGRRGLHVMVVQSRSAARLLALALAAVARGTSAVARTPELDAFVVDRCRIEPRTARGRWHIALDGEIVDAGPALDYELLRDAVRIVVPAAAGTLLPPHAAEE